MKTQNTPSNIPTAKLRMKMLQYVCENDYYPSDWFTLNEVEQEMMNNEISGEEYDNYVEMLSNSWDVK